MVIAVCATVFVAAVVLLGLGLRGRRTDDHPLCRGCGYDLTGRSAGTSRCGECGADLSRPQAVRVGHRVRRRGLVAMGVVLLVPSLGLLVVTGWVQGRGVDLTPYKPAWWLRQDLDAGPAAQAVALGELTTRAAAGRLSAAQVAGVADRALAVQAGSAPWVSTWGGFIESAHAAGRLDRPRWTTYARQSIGVALKARPVVRPGDAVPLSIDAAAARVAAAGFAALFDINGLQVDGRPAGKPLERSATGFAGHRGRLTFAASGYGAGYYTPQVDRTDTRSLSVGPHRAAATLRLYLYDGGDLPTSNGVVSPPDGSKQLAVIDVPVSAAFTVVDPAHEPPTLTTSPAQRAAVVVAVQVKSVAVTGPRAVRVDTLLDRPPVRLAFHVFVRPVGGGAELEVDGPEQATANSSDEFIFDAAGSLGAATHVDVTFRPDLETARNMVDTTPIWGEEVVVHNVAVTRSPK